MEMFPIGFVKPAANTILVPGMISTKQIKWWERICLLFCKPMIYIDKDCKPMIYIDKETTQDYGARTTVKYFRGKFYVIKVVYYGEGKEDASSPIAASP